MFSVDPYLGREYRRAQYECWDLLRDAWLELTGFDMGERPAAAGAALSVWRHFRQLAVPVSPSVVLMRRPRAVPHVGLFWRGRVLHIQPEGARYEPLERASFGFTEIGFYAHATRHADRRPV